MDLKIGIATGHGTGPELAEAFQKVLRHLAQTHSVQVEFCHSDRIYHSYSSLLVDGEEEVDQAISTKTIEDARHYQRFCENAVADGVSAIFRTAMSAQSLYIVRQQLEAIKAECFKLDSSNSILMVRDQAQGFYAGYNAYNDDHYDSVSRTCHFKKEVFGRIIEFALDRAREIWGKDILVDKVTMVYKFHLFDGLFHTWANEWMSRYGIKVEFVQPDTMNRNLLAFGVKGHQLLIAGNEYADIMQTVFLDRYDNRCQETSYAENVFLAPGLNRLSEYQTVHGSADDLVGKGIVNPAATIRASAAILERHAYCRGISGRVDQILEQMLDKRLTTPDQGGVLTTTECVRYFLQAVSEPELKETNALVVDGSPRHSFLCLRSAVIVVDLQNDPVMTISPDKRSHFNRKIPQVLSFARQQNREIIFVHFLGDRQYQRSSWRQRNKIYQRADWCLSESWGAAAHASGVPVGNERIFYKRAQYDPFLDPEFCRYVDERRLEHVVLLGLYADICVDATARGAFQRGLLVTVIRDCTASLHIKDEDTFRYMRHVYGAEVCSSDEFVTMPSP